MNTEGTGWNYGSLSSFVELNVNPPPNLPPFDMALLEFVQKYENGDISPPCNTPRSATVNIFCGLGPANCSSVNGSTGAQCLSGISTNPGYCLCSIAYNSSQCSSLTFNILSNNCSKGVALPLVGPGHPPLLPPTIAGIVIGTILGIIVLALLGGYVYNRSVYGKKGLRAVPLYDKCTGQEDQANYTLPSSSTSNYGSVTENQV